MKPTIHAKGFKFLHSGKMRAIKSDKVFLQGLLGSRVLEGLDNGFNRIKIWMGFDMPVTRGRILDAKSGFVEEANFCK